MKFFNRKFREICIITPGLLIFLGVIANSIRPLFPQLDGKAQPQRRSEISIPRPRRSSREFKALRAPGSQSRKNNNLLIWEIKPEQKIGNTVTMEIAHTQCGRRGGLRIIAYADRNGDGVPDQEIARSKLLTVTKPGRWSCFTFKNPEEKIFIGSCWVGDRSTWVAPGRGRGTSGQNRFGDRFYQIIATGSRLSPGPLFSDIQVRFSN